LSSKSPANLVQEMRQLGRKLGVLFRGRHEMEKASPQSDSPRHSVIRTAHEWFR
jgi:hypothetical protein